MDDPYFLIFLTEIMIFAQNSDYKASNIDLGPLLPYAKPTVKNLGVIMNIDLNLINRYIL